MLRVGDIVTVREGLPDGANPEFTVCRVVRDGAGIIKYKLSGYAGRFFTELELAHTGKQNVCPHQFNVGDRVVNIETDAVDVIDTVTRTAKGVTYTLENSLKFRYDKDLRPANYTLF